jgi:tRNA(fMet)-specific endonuclease VapC
LQRFCRADYIAKGQPLAVRHRFEMHEMQDLAMSTITVGELRFGAEKSQSPANVHWPH